MNKYLKILIGIILGSIAGYAYFYFVGCKSGACPLTSSWHISTLYGAIAGMFIMLPGKKDDKKKTQAKEGNKQQS